MKQGSRNRTKPALNFARELRGSMGASERLLWFFLRKEKLGFTFKRQVPVGPYVLDFYCPEASLAVEVDGEQRAERRDLDERRDAFMLSKGITTIRIPSLDLFERSLAINYWLELIEAACWERSGKVRTSEE